MIPAMVPNPMIPWSEACVWIGLAGLAAAALSDVVRRRIPNGIVALVALAGLARQALAGGAAPLLALGVAAGVFALATLLWLRGLLGGGDVKLLAAVALLVPFAAVPVLLLAVAVAGGVLCLLHLGLRATLPAPAPRRAGGSLRRALRVEAWRIRRGAPLPYGVAIAAGAAFVAIRPGG
jgi:prepilin peptidase CpaA